MPHLVIYYTGQLDELTNMTVLCRALADTMQVQRDEANKPVFPTGGIRVLAYPAAHWAVADGQGDYGFVYLNLRMGRGRSDAVHKAVGEALSAVAREHFAQLIASRPVGVTLQIDVGPEVFDAKHSSLHPLFQNKS
ncbi:5-carboxymethyl-2-hydroxymuconate Delta-isomerase [Roseateles toxinivorans]|uniref:5-carboxymethyl-2-hydroxymuconate isomerase n=1 Tax=Roseateles toxinivorans TaxID=270368 RepID=A0A4R6QPZ2_9BURK|nr:5-carboxymethyl-2-hydroxymuconate Delta-isomerase [Roseateles toxinivorans]TDP72773.1 5-carboxymethyl-2-hydroxymuconate isomerase [Roseateles toxinivorans]